ncbi:formyltransferase family protein [Streptomyces sp. NPDC004134]|uniref:formyltransferase family protein n=1 Tax=Streptomyces sp. NPDC004134 TaxID=3364691 RepID=UPI0036C28216
MTARLALITGHTFGRRAYEGVFASSAYLDGRIEVPLMVGLPEERAAGTAGYATVAGLAREHGAEFAAAKDGTLRELAPVIRACEPDYLLVVGWSRLVPPEVVGIAPYGGIGMHPTKLPLGRGQAPIPWTVIKGLRSTALSVFFLEQGADTGPLIAQYDLEVRARETASSLFDRMAQTHFTAGLELAPALAERRVRGEAQDGATATRWPRRRPADGRLDHAMSAAEADALVRALLGPYPRAFVSVGGTDYPVRAARLLTGEAAPASAPRAEVTATRVRFGCRDGVLELVRDLP